ncbi:MAG: hypothetical protein RL699_1952, partial [Bacteroidota bacterium]
MLLGLISTRIVLGALGEINYGIYILIAGVIGMLGVLNSSMINSSLRFITHSIGTKNEDHINKTFTTTIILHFIIGLAIIILMEIGGYFTFKYFLNIPIEKIWDAKIIFHFMVLTTYVTIISVPFDSLINANEKIFALALVDLLGSIINLLAAIYLTYSSGNLLVIYGGLVLGNQILLRIVKQLYVKIHFSKYRVDIKKYFDKKIFWSILSYSSWNILGSIASVSVVQIKSVFINNFFSVKVNAANGIASTVSSQVNQVASSMTGAIYPQLVKSEGSGDRIRMIRITEIATKFSIFLFSILALPVVFETNYLLTIWLKNVPQYTVIICQIILINLLLEKITFEVNTAIRA